MTDAPDMEPAALEACPWCGGQPKSWMVGDEDGGYWAVECHNHNDSEQTTFCGVHGDDKASSEAAWNRRAAPSTAPEAGKAAVKPLEWHGEPEWCFADTPVGHYTICRRQNPHCYRVDSHGRDRMQSFDAPNAEEAKAAAQADYERRILACIMESLP